MSVPRSAKNNHRLQWVLRYAEFGWKLFPIWPPKTNTWHDDTEGGRVLACSCPDGKNCDNPGKHPLSRLAPRGVKNATNDRDTLRDWWTRYPNANIGLATGEASGVIVLDEDGPEAAATVKGKHMPPTPATKTGRAEGGFHRYFAAGNHRVGNRTNFLPGLDLRGTGGYVIMPPSRHATGARYEWVITPGEADFAELPSWIVKALGPKRMRREVTPVHEWLRIADGVSEGERNDAATRLTGHLLRRGVDPEVAFALLIAWNTLNVPPLPDDELTRTFNSIADRELARRQKRRTRK